jgi:hypothetical protein
MSLLKLYYQPYILLLYNQFKKQADAFLSGRKSNKGDLWELAPCDRVPRHGNYEAKLERTPV